MKIYLKLCILCVYKCWEKNIIYKDKWWDVVILEGFCFVVVEVIEILFFNWVVIRWVRNFKLKFFFFLDFYFCVCGVFGWLKDLDGCGMSVSGY